ncbi:uncharacterized protein [Nicotiana tomentosiformis]|uniref:uncharacterized protein n=1 Tax=Nicotiana tomentosiformis TaxID=4098 RepID=UPI00388CBAEF
MTVSEYAVWFNDLARHAPALVSTVRERVHRFIEGLKPCMRFSMARELEMDMAYQHVVGIARRLEGMLTREREEREAKRSQEFGTYSGTRAPAAARQNRGYVGHPIHSALPAANGAPATPMSQAPYYAPPLSSAPPAWGAFSEWRGTLDHVPNRVVSFLKTQRMLEKRCDAYLAYVRDVSIDTPTVESVPIVRDYSDVFPVDLPSMLPNRDIDFGIDFLPVSQPISIPPYHMALAELKELKE